MSDVLRLTNSEMKEVRRCARKWYWSTYRRLGKRGPEMPNTALSIGNLVHEALALYYESGDDPVAYVDAHFAGIAEVTPELEMDARKENELVRAMLAGYLVWLEEEGKDQDIEVLGTERMVEVAVVPGVNLLSKIDAPVLLKSSGARLAFEHKTVQSLTFPLQQLKLDTQLLSEHLALFLDAKAKGASNDEAYDLCHGIYYNMLRKVKHTPAAKPPFFDRVEAPHNIHELRSHWHHVVAIAAEINRMRARLDAGESMHTVCPPNPTKDCSWDCPFFGVCVMADDGSDIEQALSDLYEERDPLKRYADAEAF